MGYACKIKRSAFDRSNYQRNLKANRSRSRARKQRILIERAIAAARIKLSSFNNQEGSL